MQSIAPAIGSSVGSSVGASVGSSVITSVGASVLAGSSVATGASVIAGASVGAGTWVAGAPAQALSTSERAIKIVKITLPLDYRYDDFPFLDISYSFLKEIKRSTLTGTNPV